MSTSSQSFPPRRRLSNFLSLAPNQSDSFPKQKTKQPEVATEATTEPLTTEALADISKVDAKRRTSSLSSDGSKSGFRFLKLGPVHYGEHQDESKGDYSEVAVE
ncbi:hypothetical protein QBC47DRAFT_361302 [Echria macrotheca]|uniref:Uncharacterized protein n=1 Tax=Echria macrotheca TaxID=438768 RepID=A0AAJ0BDI2_9PEZI|nr:hypothetical protein QBC47DRAFT_361302 [Echria macrotheca]